MPNVALNNFIRNLQTIEYTQKRAEALYAEDRLALRDLHSVYEALFLRAVTSFEAFLESLFISIMKRKAPYAKTRVQVKMIAMHDKALMEILLQGENYMDWLPFHRTVKRASLYLKDGRPFTELNDGDRSLITTITTIRNAIAHKSQHAMIQFHKIVIGNLSLLRNERTPAGFLRSPINPGRNRFEGYMIEMARMATTIC